MGLTQSKKNKEINDKIIDLENRIINLELLIHNLQDEFEEMIKELNKVRKYDNYLYDDILEPLINLDEEKSI